MSKPNRSRPPKKFHSLVSTDVTMPLIASANMKTNESHLDPLKLPRAWRRKFNQKLYGVAEIHVWPEGTSVRLREGGTGKRLHLRLETLARRFRPIPEYDSAVETPFPGTSGRLSFRHITLN